MIKVPYKWFRQAGVKSNLRVSGLILDTTHIWRLIWHCLNYKEWTIVVGNYSLERTYFRKKITLGCVKRWTLETLKENGSRRSHRRWARFFQSISMRNWLMYCIFFNVRASIDRIVTLHYPRTVVYTLCVTNKVLHESGAPARYLWINCCAECAFGVSKIFTGF